MLSTAYRTRRCLLYFTLLFILSCKTDIPESNFSVTIRLPNEPESLHPFFSKSSYAAQIEFLTLLPLAEFDPASLQLSPLLITEIPEPKAVTRAAGHPSTLYELHLRPEARWADGRPVTAEDYVFTVKCAYNPHLSIPSYRAQWDFLSAIETNEKDPLSISVYVDSSFILALPAVTNFNLYPAHVYDPELIMSKFSLEELRDAGHVWTTAQDTLLKKFAEEFESVTFFRETVTGAGPYELSQWRTGEEIALTKKKNWWGDQIKNPPLQLQAYPHEVVYKFLLDASAAEAALKSGEIDVMGEVPAGDFVNIKNDPAWSDKFQFATPSLPQVYYLELNTRDSILADKRIRQALAYSIDYNGLMQNVLKGLAQRTIGPVHPDKPYYDKALTPIAEDVSRALALVKEAGWSDSNGNGIPDKMIGGKRRELSLTIKIANKEEGTMIANIVRENAARAGFDLKIEALEPTQFNQDIRQNNFEISPLRVRSYPTPDDFFTLWHSASDRAGGSNRSGFHTPELDKVIETIRTTDSEQERDQMYKRLQEIIYEAQPAIFLYVPLERIIASKRIELFTSSRRPGYFEYLMKPAD